MLHVFENVRVTTSGLPSFTNCKVRVSTNNTVGTGDQQFFISFGQSWRTKYREAMLRQIVTTDGHAPDEYRADTVRNIDAWYDAFKVQPGQKLYLDPAKRVKVW